MPAVGTGSTRLVSVVVPAWNEAGSLPELYSRLQTVFAAERDVDFELIVVDDGSTDETVAVLKQLRARDPRVRFYSLSRNFGHQAALTAGLDYAKGKAVIFMDADLQHPPEVIPELLKRWRAGDQVVNTVRLTDERLPLLKRLGTGAFYWLINKLSATEIEPNAADFRLLDRRAAEGLKQIGERARFIRGLVSWLGYRRSWVQFKADKRFAGKTKYSFRKMLRLALDGLFSFSTVPLKAVSWLGFFVVVGAVFEATVALYAKLVVGNTMQGWTSLLIVILFLGGTQMITLGVFGSYLANVYEEARRRPLYLVGASSEDEEEVAAPVPVARDA
jgi:dolichol-phosphate mannosyltransferase